MFLCGFICIIKLSYVPYNSYSFTTSLKTLIIISLVLGFYSLSWGQNLVPNPSFEDITSCPPYFGEFNVVDWTSPNTASPDLFHSCSNGNAGVPQNAFGWQYPRTGDAYVGGHTSDFGGNNGREYIQCQLISPMVQGEKYEVIFFVSRTDSSTKACDNIGAYFSTNAISSSNTLNFNVVPQVVSAPQSPIKNDTGWVQIIDTITAFDNYQYLTIGVFTDDANTNWIPVQGGWEDEAHYYYDDISVKQIASSSIDENFNIQLSVFPNPSDGLVNVSCSENFYGCIVYSMFGKTVYSIESLKTKQHQILVQNCSEGIYFVDILFDNRIIRKKVFVNP